MTLTKSKGATLAVSLVMLTAVTFVAVLGLQRSTLQTRMVANTQHSQQAFNIASSELEGNYTEFEFSQLGTEKLVQAMNSVEKEKVDGKDKAIRDENTGEFNFLPHPLDPMSTYNDSKATITTKLEYISGRAITVNRTLSGDSSQSQFTAHHFVLSSEAKASDNIKSSQELALQFLASRGQ